jgi:hypothetical protein
MNRRRAAAAVITLIAGTTAVVTGAAAGRSASPRIAVSTPVTNARASAQAAGFETLMEQAPAMDLPQAVRDLPPDLESTWGLDPTQVRAVANGATPWYVIPGTKGICFYRLDVGGCVSLDDAAAGRLAIVGISPTEKTITEVIGLAPDGVAAVSAGEGQSRVANNTYDITAAHADGSKPGVTLHLTAGGTKSVSFLDG